MNLLIKPIFQLINRLSYRNKFVLIASIFAVPLVIFAVQLAYSYHQDANQANLTKNGLQYLKDSTELIESLETLRDTSVISFIQQNELFRKKYTTAQLISLQKIQDINTHYNSPKHAVFLTKLRAQVNTDIISPGNEGAKIQNIFDAVEVLVEDTYAWRTKLSHEFISKSVSNTSVVSVLNMLNDSKAYLKTLGMTRTFGSLYLLRGYIDSQGIQGVEQNYQDLTRLIQQIDVQQIEHHELIESYPKTEISKLKLRLIETRQLLEQELIQTMPLNKDPSEYYAEASLIFEEFYQHNHYLLDLANILLEEKKQQAIDNIILFYVSAITMLVLIIYLYTGLYTSVGHSIKQLLISARSVAAGEYDKPIHIDAKDELSAVAKAMDAMRLKIKDREETLTIMGQTDGLTQVKNRQFFDDALSFSLASSRRNNTPLVLVMMDIDYFKAVNDKHGHQAGDECLKQIAKRFKLHFQRQTDIVARYGGEEFIAILYGATLEDSILQTEALRAAIAAAPIKTAKHQFAITASFGLAALEPGQLATEDELVSLADAMLYQSKNHGRNRISSARFQAPGTNHNNVAS